jgi:hypothetical protein
VTHVVFLFGAEARIKIGKKAVRLLLVHLVQAAYLLFVSLIHCGVSSIVWWLITATILQFS